MKGWEDQDNHFPGVIGVTSFATPKDSLISIIKLVPLFLHEHIRLNSSSLLFGVDCFFLTCFLKIIRKEALGEEMIASLFCLV